MIHKEELIKWIENYDNIKYPTQIYDELVVGGKEYINKFSLMGAWKTGSIRIDDKGSAYEDKNGCKYSYTKRWKENAPVGYNVWNYISNNQEELKKQIPLEFSNEKPSVAVELESKNGFGFIWTVFVLHCFYPEIYPLYDQHVYRAYKFMSSEEKESYNTAPNDWSEYKNYKKFFNDLLNDLNIEYWKLDRGLWAYGKHLKQSKIAQNIGNYITEKSTNDEKHMCTEFAIDEEWTHSTTFGGKAKSFWWRVDEDFNLLILRKFKGLSEVTSKLITCAELEKIDNFMKNRQWVDLANNIEKINNGTEKDGLGKFVSKLPGWNNGEAQLASHLGVIFTLSGAWNYNGLKRGIKFKRNNFKWQEQLKQYYIDSVNEDINFGIDINEK